MKNLVIFYILVFGFTLSAQAQWSDGISGEIYYNSGNVGIGTSDPARILHVKGTSGSDVVDGLTISGIAILTNSSGSGLDISTYDNGNTILRTTYVGKDLVFGTRYNAVNFERMRITATGSVGIGVSNPARMLHVKGTSGSDVVDGLTVSGIAILTNSSGSGLDISTYDNGNTILRTTYSGKDLVFGTRSNAANFERMRITSTGNVGIGTVNPGTFKLAVEGKIGAREVQVTAASPWPDYVFNNSYPLTPLMELDKYLKIYNHLPGIPDAKTVKEEGVKLGEMNAKLLEKVEELTLYIIELKNRMDKLEGGRNE